jgi:hypothetical protein
MNWDGITLSQYLQIHPIIENKWTDLEKFKEIVYILTGKYEPVETWGEDQIKQYKFLFDLNLQRNIVNIFKAGDNWYRINTDTDRMAAARYIEAKTFYANGYMQNIHRLIASFCVPIRWRWYKFKDKPFNATKHEQYASDMMKLSFPFAYSLGNYFLNMINGIDKKYPVLFGQQKDEEETATDMLAIDQVFSKYYGWIYSATQVAEHERITLDSAFELPVLQFLNDLAYLKMKHKVERKQIEEAYKKK